MSGAREESRIPLEDVGPGFFARQPRARMTEQAIDQDATVTMICRDSIRSLARLRERASGAAVAIFLQPP